MKYLHDKEDHYFVGISIVPAAVSLFKHPVPGGVTSPACSNLLSVLMTA